MPDKHEVGGSSPLGPTRAQACSGKRGQEERVLHRRYKYASAERDSQSTWANQDTTCPGEREQEERALHHEVWLYECVTDMQLVAVEKEYLLSF